AIANPTSAAVSFTPVDNGSFTVTLVVTSTGTGKVFTATRQLFVANVAPTALINEGSTHPEGATITLTSTVSDPSSQDTLTYLWQVVASNGQIIPDGHATTFSFSPNDNGSYDVTLTVTDDDGGVTTALDPITVTNVAPSVSLATPSGVTEGSLVQL